MPVKTTAKKSKVEQETPVPVPLERRNRFTSFKDFQNFVAEAFVDGSGIDPVLFAECVDFYEDLEVDDGHDASYPIHEALGWNVTRFGHQARENQYAAILKNEDGSVWQAIISDWDEERQRPYKYLAPTGNGDRAFLPPVPNVIRQKIAKRYGVEVPNQGSFWEWVRESEIPIPRILAEGGKKSLSALSQGYLSIALYGCLCGGKDSLISDLLMLHGEGKIWLFGFDRDNKDSAKKAVTIGKKRLTASLSHAAKCFIEDIWWSHEDGKGIDDLIVGKGSGAFDVAYAKAISRLEKQFKTGGHTAEDETDKPPNQAIMAREIAEKYRDILAYNNDISCWMRYAADADGMWSRETDEYIEAVVYQIILSEGYERFTSAFVSSVVRLMRHKLIERVWGEREPNKYLPFKNGVLEISTGNLIAHAPGYRFTWQLPRNHEPAGERWDNISNFLDHLAAGNPKIKDLLLCYCNAVIKGRSDLQRFLHLIGIGGTGKGSFARLVVSLIGVENVHSTSLEEWCRDKFEPANAYKKRLVIFPDEPPYPGKIGKFLSLTGEDHLRGEEKHRTAFKFKYDGMVLLLSNFPVFSGAAANAIRRRSITLPCNNPVAIVKRRNLEADFDTELSAFTAHVLSLSDDHVGAVLSGVEEIAECTLEFWENRMRVDSIASWVNQQIIYDATALTPIGHNRHEGSNGETIYTLFGSYSRHCNQLGNTPKSHNNFSPDLIELCKSVLSWPIESKKTNTGRFIKGIRLRTSADEHIPTYDVWLTSRTGDTKRDGSDGASDTQSDGLNTLLYKESDGSDGLESSLLKILETENSLQDFKASDVKPSECDRTSDVRFEVGEDVLLISHPDQSLVGSIQRIAIYDSSPGVAFKSGVTCSSKATIRKIDAVSCDRTSTFEIGDTVRFTHDVQRGGIESTPSNPGIKIASKGDLAVVTRDRGMVCWVQIGSNEETTVCKDYLEKELPALKPSECEKKTAKKRIDYDFWLIDSTILSFEIPSKLGEIVITAEPKKAMINRARMKSGYICTVTWHWPNGKKSSFPDVPIEAASGKEDFEGLGRRIAKEWIEKETTALEPWKPQVTKPAMYGGEIVTVVGGGGWKRQIEFASGAMLEVPLNQLSQPPES